MAEPTSTTTLAATSAACGTIPLPLLCALGIDLGALVFGLVGCVIVQCHLRPEKGRDLGHIAALTVGGTLFAGLVAPVATPHVLTYLGDTSPRAVGNLVAAACGGFAQPLLVLARAWLVSKFTPRPAQIEKP